MMKFFFVAMGDLLMTTTKKHIEYYSFKLLFVLLTQSSGKTKKNCSRGNCTELRPDQCEEVVK